MSSYRWIIFQDVDQLTESLPNVVHKYLIEDEEFTHLDFMLAVDVNTLVHDEIVALMKNYWEDFVVLI